MDALSGLVSNLVLLFVMGIAIIVIMRLAGSAISDWLSDFSQTQVRGEDRDAPGAQYPYRRRSGLFTPTEKSFLSVLDHAVGTTHRVFGKVRLADIIDVRHVKSRGAWRTAFNRISSKHIDFLVCDRDALRIVAAIELDDASHDAPARQSRDRFVEHALAAAGVELVRVPVASTYDLSSLRQRIFGPGGVNGLLPESTTSADAPRPPRCPVCGTTTVRRTMTRGAGLQVYYACDQTPACSGRVTMR